ncbi:MAG: T9SS type A sorting domain-containing protein, partial [Bacteroidota bacterium]|nr:T9SS type A sorting domain-containing protein [Bacteroidota bacterium]
KSIDINGKIEYSKVVKVFIPLLKQSITVFPNPVKEGIINLQMVNQREGLYSVRLLNTQGQAVLKATVQHAADTGIEKIIIEKGIAKGIYTLEIKKPDDEIITNKLIY